VFSYGRGDPNTVTADFTGFRVQVDSEGRFVFPRVPPGAHSLSRAIPLPPPQENSFSIEHLEGVEIRAGETTTVTLGSGYTVSAHLRWAEGAIPVTSEEIFAIVQTPYPAELKQLMKGHPAMAELKQSPVFREFVRTARSIQAIVTSDGTVTAEGVRAGEYVLNVMVMPALDARQVGQRAFPRAKGEMSFTVPAEPPSGSLDLGEIVVDKFDGQP
jgi:hypothetical protein